MDRRAKVELVEVLRERYVASEKQAKSRILDELVQITGYHRKYALRLLRKSIPPPAFEAHGRRRIYDDAVKEALIVYWAGAQRLGAIEWNHLLRRMQSPDVAAV